MGPMFNLPVASKSRVKQLMANRHPLALGAAGGSFASLAFRFLTEQFEFPSQIGASLDCVCPAIEFDSWNNKSLFLGILIGLALWPLLELLVLLRRWWIVVIRRQLALLSQNSSKLYRVV